MSVSLFLLCKYVHLYHFLSFRVQVMSSVTLVSVWPGVIMSRSISVAEVPFCKVNRLGFLKLELSTRSVLVTSMCECKLGLVPGPWWADACLHFLTFPSALRRGLRHYPLSVTFRCSKALCWLCIFEVLPDPPSHCSHIWSFCSQHLPSSFGMCQGGLSPRSFGPALSSTWTSFPAEGHVASPCVSLCPYWNVTYRMRAFLTTVHGTLSRCTWILWEFTSLSWFTLIHDMHHHGVWWT